MVDVGGADKKVIFPRRVKVCGVGVVREQPHAGDQDLHEAEHGADHELGAGRNETRSFRRLPASLEDPCDADGLGQEGAVDDGEDEAGEEELETTDEVGWSAEKVELWNSTVQWTSEWAWGKYMFIVSHSLHTKLSPHFT